MKKKTTKKKIETVQDDPINHPKYYNSGRIEVIEAIEDWGMDYHRGNAIKYIARAGRKDLLTITQDLEKAIWYLNRKIEVIRAAVKGEVTAKPDNTPIARRK